MKPDIVSDFQALPFRAGVFDTVYFDPPHKHGYGGFMKDQFSGYGSYENGRKLLLLSSKELSRVLKPNGLLVTKLLSSPPSAKHHESLFETYMPRIFAEYANCWGLKTIGSRKRPSMGMSRNATVIWSTFVKNR